MVNSEGGYTVDPTFEMPTVATAPSEPATPVQSRIVYGFDPGSSYGVLAYREGDKITIMEEGKFKVRGTVTGRIWSTNEDHIVRGYD